MEGFQTIAGGISKGDQLRHTTLVSKRSGFALHGDVGGFKAGSERVESCGIGDFPAEDLRARLNGPVDKQALFAVVHTEGAH